MYNFELEVFKRASLCRNFEQYVFDGIKNKLFKFPLYLSAGQEYISATIAQVMNEQGIDPNVFIQHRGHSTYLSFDAPITGLIDELLGRKTGCTNGMGGSASIHSKERNIFGHDGLMGSQVPIAVGHCYKTKHPTIVYMGDASAEEDYVLGALGWASTKRLPILFVVEDNNLSILVLEKNKSFVANFNLESQHSLFQIPNQPQFIPYICVNDLSLEGLPKNPKVHVNDTVNKNKQNFIFKYYSNFIG